MLAIVCAYFVVYLTVCRDAAAAAALSQTNRLSAIDGPCNIKLVYLL